MVAPPPITRASTDQRCKCTLCKIAGLKNSDYSKHAEKYSNKVGAPSEKIKSPAAKSIPICSKCLSVIGKGQAHNCGKPQRLENIREVFKSKNYIMNTSLYG